MSERSVIRLVVGISMCAVLTGSARGQYGGGGTMGGTMGGATTAGTSGGVYTAPKGGYSSSTGIAIGAGAAAGVGLAYLALRHHGTMVGCIESSSDGLKLMNEKDKNTYALIASNDVVLAPGERVTLKGKKTKDDSGRSSFEVHKLVKDYGSCKQ